MTQTAQHPEHTGVVEQLSTLDRFLPVWIGVAMISGLLLGRWLPGLNAVLDHLAMDGICVFHRAQACSS